MDGNVMAGLDPAIIGGTVLDEIAGSSPAMTWFDVVAPDPISLLAKRSNLPIRSRRLRRFVRNDTVDRV
jgi:hypothetical protein